MRMGLLNGSAVVEAMTGFARWRDNCESRRRFELDRSIKRERSGILRWRGFLVRFTAAMQQ